MPEVGTNSPPNWIGLLRGLYDPQRRDAIPVCAYSPVQGLNDQMTPVMQLILNQKDPSKNPIAEEYIKHKPWLGLPPGPELNAAMRSGCKTLGATDVQLYMLLRATHLFVDLEGTVGMGTGLPIAIADRLGVKCVGIGAAFAVNPWLDRYLPYKIHPGRQTVLDVVWGR